VYVDASDACNTLAFQLGQTAVGTTIPTRSWSLKVFFILQDWLGANANQLKLCAHMVNLQGHSKA
jgi:hypothetical protein